MLGISADGNRLVLEQSTGAERFYAVRTRSGTTSRATSDPRIGSTAFLSEDGSTPVYDLVTSPRRLVARSLDDDREIDIPISLEQWSVFDVSANGDTLVLVSGGISRWRRSTARSLVAVDMAGRTGPSLPQHLFRVGSAPLVGGFSLSPWIRTGSAARTTGRSRRKSKCD